MRRRRGRPLDGWLIIDKPAGMTSTDVVNRVRRGFDAQKAGHGGTLDPLATGVLPIAFGAATKTVPYIMDATKLYRFTLRLGETRDTDDADGTVMPHRPLHRPQPRLGQVRTVVLVPGPRTADPRILPQLGIQRTPSPTSQRANERTPSRWPELRV